MPDDFNFDDPVFQKKMEKLIKKLEKLSDKDLPAAVSKVWKRAKPGITKSFAKKNFQLWGTLWDKGIQQTYIDGIKKTSYSTTVAHPGVVRELADEYFEKHGLELVKTLTETDVGKLKGQMAKNWGKGEDAFAKEFKDSYSVSPERIKRVYRTEHHRAMNQGVLAVSKRLGRSYKLWVVIGDERTCDICGAHIDDIVPIDEPFQIIDKDGNIIEIDIPNDSHVGCRCAMLTIREKNLTEDQRQQLVEKGYLEDETEEEFGTDGDLWTPREEFPSEEFVVPDEQEYVEPKENEAFDQKLNYKCPKGTIDGSNKCDIEKKEGSNNIERERGNKTRQKYNSKDNRYNIKEFL